MSDVTVKERGHAGYNAASVLDARFFETYAKVNDVENWQRKKFRFALAVGAVLVLLNLTGVLKLTRPTTVYFMAVLLIHELGHYVGMRLCGYRAVGMLFLPFLSDSAQGVRTHSSPLREAVVILLGPLPGLFIALALSCLAVLEFSHSLFYAAIYFLAFNTISLLPCLPFDGGRLLQRVILVRCRYLMVLVQVPLASALALGGWLLGMEFTVILGLGSLYWTSVNFRFDSIAQRLHDHFPEQEGAQSRGEISIMSAAMIVNELRQHVPVALRFGMDAWAVRSIWERVMAKRAGLGTILASLTAYAAAFVMIVIAIIGLMTYPEEHVSAIPLADGTQQQRATVSVLGKKIIEVDVSDDGFYHGVQKSYVFGGDTVHMYGEWKDGYMEGVWTSHTTDGAKQSRMTFKRGELVGCEEFRDGAWTDSDAADLPWSVRYDLWRHGRSAPEGPHQHE